LIKKLDKERPVSTGEAIMGTMVMKTVAMIYTMGKMRCTCSMYQSNYFIIHEYVVLLKNGLTAVSKSILIHVLIAI
jgi:hypothetical protein